MNLLLELSSFEDVVHVIDVSATSGGAWAKVIADPQTCSAVCFLDKTKEKGKPSQKEEEGK